MEFGGGGIGCPPDSKIIDCDKMTASEVPDHWELLLLQHDLTKWILFNKHHINRHHIIYA